MPAEAVDLALSLAGRVRELPRQVSTGYVSILNPGTTGSVFDGGRKLTSIVDATGAAVVSSGPSNLVQEAGSVLRRLAILPGDSAADDLIDDLMERNAAEEESVPLPVVD